MAKKKSVLLVQGLQTKKNVKHIPDHKIDYSDIPPLTDEQLKGLKRIGRPFLGNEAKKSIAIRIDPTILKKLKKLAAEKNKGYQTLINEVLKKFVDKKSA